MGASEEHKTINEEDIDIKLPNKSLFENNPNYPGKVFFVEPRKSFDSSDSSFTDVEEQDFLY